MKVKCRIALAVDYRGTWAVQGYSDATDEELMGCVADSLDEGERRYWVEVEVEAPLPDSEVPVISAVAVPV